MTDTVAGWLCQKQTTSYGVSMQPGRGSNAEAGGLKRDKQGGQQSSPVGPVLRPWFCLSGTVASTHQI